LLPLKKQENQRDCAQWVTILQGKSRLTNSELAHDIKDKRRNDLLKERREVKRKAEEIKNNIFHTPQLAE
jgi:hypothetical protein